MIAAPVFSILLSMVIFMASIPPKISGLFPPPDRTDCAKAVARALLRIRSEGWSLEKLGKLLDCSGDTIANASNEKGLLSLDSVALLGYYFPEEFSLIESLWTCAPTKPLTVAERLDVIEMHQAAIRREVA